MTEHRDGNLNQICLVQNPPASSDKLYSLINEFNRANPTESSFHKRLFIKEHDYELPIFPFPHNPEYKSTTTTRNDLDNIDFLGNSYIFLGSESDTIRKTKVYIGELYYYKK